MSISNQSDFAFQSKSPLKFLVYEVHFQELHDASRSHLNLPMYELVFERIKDTVKRNILVLMTGNQSAACREQMR